jgi:hypothetical protein
MRHLVPWLWLAGVIQLIIVVANFVLPKKLRCRENVARLSPMMRELFVVHWIYIVFVLTAFASLCFWFAPDLAGANRLGRFLSGVMAAFWLLRVPIQLFFYDPAVRRENRLADVVFLLAFSYLCVVFSIAALGPLQ